MSVAVSSPLHLAFAVGGVSVVVPVVVLATIAAALGLRRYASGRSRFPAIVAIIALDLIGATVPVAAPLGIAAMIAIVCVAWLRARPSMRAWRADARDPLVLAAPFEGRWFVAAGGPAPGLNHHLIASDQRFAYDFIRRDAESFGSAILAPCAGIVVSVENAMPDLPPSRNPDRPESRGRELGNHVGIETDRGTVFLCHLRSGSVRVALGDRVQAGMPIGMCGNSGRTTRPHLHIHAQNLPYYALFEATGVPVAFRDERGARVLHWLEHLHGTPAQRVSPREAEALLTHGNP